MRKHNKSQNYDLPESIVMSLRTRNYIRQESLFKTKVINRNEIFGVCFRSCKTCASSDFGKEQRSVLR